MTIERITTTDAPAPAGAYSQGIVADGFVWTAGFGPQDPTTGEVPAEVGAQTTQALANVRAVLATRGLDLSDVVKVTVHLQELRRDFAEYDVAYTEQFSPPYPVRTTVGSQLMNILVEIDVVARLRK